MNFRKGDAEHGRYCFKAYWDKKDLRSYLKSLERMTKFEICHGCKLEITDASGKKGYQLAKPVQLTIKDTGKVQIVIVKDAPIPEVTDTSQTGGNMLILPIAAGLLMVVGATVMIWKKRVLVKK